jgi:hypothetical protein
MAFSPQEVAARLEILDVISRYSVHIDAGEFDRLQPLFADNAVFDITPDPVFMKVPVTGARAIREALEARYRVVVQEAQRRHVMTNTVFDQLGTDHAATRTFLSVLSVPKGGGAIEVRGTGVYNDTFTAAGGAWRIRRRYLVMDALGR